MADGRHGNQGHQGGRRREEELVIADEIAADMEKLKNFSALSTDMLVAQAEKAGGFLAARPVGLKTNQIRKFLDAVNEIKSRGSLKSEEDSFFRSSCLLLKPKLAYAAGRQNKGVKFLMTILTPCIDKVHKKEDFLRFYRFVEAIIAYHRYHGGD